MQVGLVGSPRIPATASALLGMSAPVGSPIADTFTASATPPKEEACLPARALYTVGCSIAGAGAGFVAFGPIGALGGAFGAYYGIKNSGDVSLKSAAIVAGATVAGALAGNALAGAVGASGGAVLGFVIGETLRRRG
jgi:hypothetical protein